MINALKNVCACLYNLIIKFNKIEQIQLNKKILKYVRYFNLKKFTLRLSYFDGVATYYLKYIQKIRLKSFLELFLIRFK